MRSGCRSVSLMPQQVFDSSIVNLQIEEPIAGSAQSNALATISCRIELSTHSPSHRAPSACERGDEKASEYNHDITDGLIVGAISVFKGELSERGKYQEADEHPGSPSHQAFSSAELFDKVQARESRGDIDSTYTDCQLHHILKSAMNDREDSPRMIWVTYEFESPTDEKTTVP